MTAATTSTTTGRLAPTFAIARQFVPKDAVEVAVTAPTDGQPTGIVITLAGRYTKAFKEAHAILQAAGVEITDEEAAAAMRKAVAAATIDWTGVLDAEGNALPYDRDTAEALYGHPHLDWLWAQVVQAFTDRARFFATAEPVQG